MKYIKIALFTLFIAAFVQNRASPLPLHNQYTIQNPDDIKEITGLKGADDLATLKNIWVWKNTHFTLKPAGGKYIGKLTINDLLKSHHLSGCHDVALLFVAALNYFKIPALMVETTGIKFSKNLLHNPNAPYEGHVFVEVKIKGKWVLFDPKSGQYIEDYSPNNPVIPINLNTQNEGFYVMCKGRDSWDCGIKSVQDVQALQRNTAYSVDFSKLNSPRYTIKTLAGI